MLLIDSCMVSIYSVGFFLSFIVIIDALSVILSILIYKTDISDIIWYSPMLEIYIISTPITLPMSLRIIYKWYVKCKVNNIDIFHIHTNTLEYVTFVLVIAFMISIFVRPYIMLIQNKRL